MDRRKAIAGLTALGLGSLCGACSGGGTSVVVGSKNLTEQTLLGEILAQYIERRLQLKVQRKLNLGGTLLAHQALVNGEIDLYPEYTGTALTAVLKQKPIQDPSAALDTVTALYKSRWKLDWLPPLGFDNTFAMIIGGKEARERRLKTLSDAAAAHPWRLGVGYEFVGRPDGLQGLISTYGIRMAESPQTMDLGLLYTALEGRRVDMIAASATDGLISKLDVAVLQDDKHYFPPYQCAVVFREAAENKAPGLRAALVDLSGKISEEKMRQLNYEVDVAHRPERQVASDFLNSK